MKIQLDHLTKKFKNTVAVCDMDCTIEDGEMVCLLGPSGCGKSTTLSMIAGLERPTEGEIYFDGQPMSEVEAEQRDIGMVFQNYALYPHMTVSENIQFPLKMKWMKKKERIQKVEKIAELIQIKDLLKRKPSQLSGGQQQRVAIARALIKEPKILLLDEPFSNLDARLRIELRDEIRALQKKLGITTIFVTHDQEEAMSISDRILLMNKGKVQQYSTPHEMYRYPENIFVAKFLGNPPINLFDCNYIENQIQLEGKEAWKSEEIHPYIREVESQKAILGIRPEDFLIVPKDGQFCAEIVSIQTLGKEIYLRLKEEKHYFTACLSWDQVFHIGDIVHLNIKKSYLFPDLEEKSEGGVENEK